MQTETRRNHANLSAAQIDYCAKHGISFGHEMSSRNAETLSGPHGHCTVHNGVARCVRPTGWANGLRQYHTVEYQGMRAALAFLLGKDDGPKIDLSK